MSWTVSTFLISFSLFFVVLLLILLLRFFSQLCFLIFLLLFSFLFLFLSTLLFSFFFVPHASLRVSYRTYAISSFGRNFFTNYSSFYSHGSTKNQSFIRTYYNVHIFLFYLTFFSSSTVHLSGFSSFVYSGTLHFSFTGLHFCVFISFIR